MNNHDPLKIILDELCNCNDLDTEEALKASLAKTKEPLKDLRNAYSNSPSNVDFRNEYYRAAYLLAYYPYYIDRIFEILRVIPEQKRNFIFSGNKIRGCFLGAGPAPEVIGWISFLQCHYPNVKNAVAYIFDKNIHFWSKGLEITRYHLAPNYWDGNLTLCQRELDLLQLSDALDDSLIQAIKKSNLFVMQNCINDLNHDSSSLCETIVNIFKLIEPGSLFIISDLNFSQVRKTVVMLKNLIEKENLGKCICHVSQGCVIHKPKIVVPSILENELFEEVNGLMQKRKANYCYCVIERTSQQDNCDDVGEIEFDLYREGIQGVDTQISIEDDIPF